MFVYSFVSLLIHKHNTQFNYGSNLYAENRNSVLVMHELRIWSTDCGPIDACLISRRIHEARNTNYLGYTAIRRQMASFLRHKKTFLLRSLRGAFWLESLPGTYKSFLNSEGTFNWSFMVCVHDKCMRRRKKSKNHFYLVLKY